MTLHAADISLEEIDLSDMAFWAGSRDVREATFQMLRDTPDLQHFDERVIDESPFLPGATAPDTARERHTSDRSGPLHIALIWRWLLDVAVGAPAGSRAFRRSCRLCGS
jgi:hypothetical protein